MSQNVIFAPGLSFNNMNFDPTTSMIFDSFMVNIKDSYPDDAECHIIGPRYFF